MQGMTALVDTSFITLRKLTVTIPGYYKYSTWINSERYKYSSGLMYAC